MEQAEKEVLDKLTSLNLPRNGHKLGILHQLQEFDAILTQLAWHSMVESAPTDSRKRARSSIPNDLRFDLSTCGADCITNPLLQTSKLYPQIILRYANALRTIGDNTAAALVLIGYFDTVADSRQTDDQMILAGLLAATVSSLGNEALHTATKRHLEPILQRSRELLDRQANAMTAAAEEIVALLANR